jgi:DNA-binding NarL/FixJ family response regulator
MTGSPLTILVAEDHPLFRQALVDLLGGHPGWEVVAEAEDGVGAVTAAHAEQPDVAVMDLKLPRLDGIEATRRIVAASPHIGVLVLTMYDDDASVFEAMRAGARGYLLKGADREEIVRAVLAVAGGDAVYGGAVARRVVDALTGTGARAPAFPELTEREGQVLELLAAGLATGRIAQRLALSDKTVCNHVSAVLTKLQVPDRSAAVARAREAGLGRS